MKDLTRNLKSLNVLAQLLKHIYIPLEEEHQDMKTNL